MGQGRNSRRNSSLDDKKERAAGRLREQAAEPVWDMSSELARRQTKGAFGRWGIPDRSDQQGGLREGGNDTAPPGK